MARYTDSEKRIFAKAYAASHNYAQAFLKIRPDSNVQDASKLGKRMSNNVQIKPLIAEFEQEYRTKTIGLENQRVLNIEERRQALSNVIYRTLLNEEAIIDDRMMNVGLKALDIANKMDGVYIEKRQVEITQSLADVIKGVDKDAD